MTNNGIPVHYISKWLEKNHNDLSWYSMEVKRNFRRMIEDWIIDDSPSEAGEGRDAVLITILEELKDKKHLMQLENKKDDNLNMAIIYLESCIDFLRR